MDAAAIEKQWHTHQLTAPLACSRRSGKAEASSWTSSVRKRII